MGKSTSWETGLLNLVFDNLAYANVGNAGGLQPSSAAGNFFVALHTADPGVSGDQTTNETSYTGYARVAVVRSSSGWTISGNSVSNTAAINFGLCTAGTPTITHFSIGTAVSGADTMLYSGALTNSLAVSNGITPSFAIGALSVSES